MKQTNMPESITLLQALAVSMSRGHTRHAASDTPVAAAAHLLKDGLQVMHVSEAAPVPFPVWEGEHLQGAEQWSSQHRWELRTQVRKGCGSYSPYYVNSCSSSCIDAAS